MQRALLLGFEADEVLRCDPAPVPDFDGVEEDLPLTGSHAGSDDALDALGALFRAQDGSPVNVQNRDEFHFFLADSSEIFRAIVRRAFDR